MAGPTSSFEIPYSCLPRHRRRFNIRYSDPNSNFIATIIFRDALLRFAFLKIVTGLFQLCFKAGICRFKIGNGRIMLGLA